MCTVPLMFLACLASVVGLPSLGNEQNPSLWTICNGTLDGDEVCAQKGLGLYTSSSSNPASHPITFYALSNSVFTFTETTCREALGLTGSDPAYSAKFTGLFSPPVGGNYTFRITGKHDYDGAHGGEVFNIGSLMLEMDTTSDSEKTSMICSTLGDEGCLNEWTTNCEQCVRYFALTRGVVYPFYAGFITTVEALASYGVTVTIDFLRPGGSDYEYVTSSNSVLGYVTGSGSSAVSNSSSKDRAGIIAGATLGAIAAVIIIAFSIWLVVNKFTGIGGIAKRRRSSSSSHQRSGNVLRRVSSVFQRLSGGLVPRSDGGVVPRGGGAVSRGSSVVSRSGSVVSRGGSVVSRSGGVVSRSGRVVSRSGGVVPRSGRVVPRSGSVVPRSGGVAPGSGGVVPRSGGVVPRSGGVAPGSGSVVPRSGGVVPRSGGVAPGGGSVVPRSGGGSQRGTGGGRKVTGGVREGSGTVGL